MSFLRSSPRISSNYSRHFDIPEAETSEHVGGAMLPIFLNNLQTNNNDRDLVEVTLELEDNSFVFCTIKPSPDHNIKISAGEEEEENSPSGLVSSSTRASPRKFSWLRSPERSDHHHFHQNQMTEMKSSKLKTVRNKSSTQRALGGLRFISKTTGECDTNNDLWGKVEIRFNALAKDGLLTREDFGECIGTFYFLNSYSKCLAMAQVVPAIHNAKCQ